MQYAFKPRALRNIWIFYRNVAKKYKHVYDSNDMERNIRQAVLDAYRIEQSLLRRKPTLKRWQNEGWHMANAGKWYYAYTIGHDTMIIEDACLVQYMYEE